MRPQPAGVCGTTVSACLRHATGHLPVLCPHEGARLPIRSTVPFPRAGVARRRCQGKDREHIPYGELVGHRLGQGHSQIDFIVIDPPHALLGKVSRGFKIRNDTAHRPLGQR
jgi:hypothetical protein